MTDEISTVKLRQNLGEALNRVQYRNDALLIQKDGKAVAARSTTVTTTLRVALDTNVLLSGLAYPGSVPGKIVTA